MSEPLKIKTLGEVLEALIAHERSAIADFEAEGYEITHGPTIGDIYEGLTENLLSRAVPKELNLRVTNGFIVGRNRQRSGQIDCMLVRGPGVQIPNTKHEVVEIQNVLVVFEVKKTLYGSEFPDIIDHFHQLMDLDPILSGPIDATSVFRAFSQITGIHLQEHNENNTQQFHHQLIYHSLVSERVRPVRIAIGYDGFKSESGMRKSFVELLQKNVGKKWIPPTNWPDLLISGDYSMIKLNGRPYLSPSKSDFWDVFATSNAKPVHLLLEAIYTRIAEDDNMVDFWGEDLEQEVLNPFLQAKAVQQGETGGWEWQHIELDENHLSQNEPVQPWLPYFPDDEEAIVFTLLMQAPDGLDIAVIENGIGDRAAPLLSKLTSTGLVARNGNKLFLTTVEARMGFYRGEAFVGEDNTGKLSRWLSREAERNSKIQS